MLLSRINKYRSAPHPLARKRHLAVETLENRNVLSVYTVLNSDDNGAGSLRQAIIDSNLVAGADTVVFAPQVHGDTIQLLSGQLLISDDLSIDASAGKPVTIQGNDTFRIFKVDDGTNNQKSVYFSNLVITRGNANTEPFTDNLNSRRGGGIDNRESLVLRTSEVVRNAARHGGGISTAGTSFDVSGARGTLTIVDSMIRENTTLNDDACAIAVCDDDELTPAPPPDRNGGRGSGVAVANNSGLLNVLRSTIADNSGPGNGAGLDIRSGVRAGISQSTIERNHITAGGSGGGFHISNVDAPQLLTSVITTTSTIRWNSISVGGQGEGGGVHVVGSSVATPLPVSISRSTFSGNVGYLGGGMSAIGNVDVSLDQCTLSGNSSTSRGGAIRVYGTTKTVARTLVNGCTITRNSSAVIIDDQGGGGLFVSAFVDPGGIGNGMADVQLKNSIVSGNIDGNQDASDIFDSKAYAYGGMFSYTTGSFNLIGNNIHSGFSEGNPDAMGNLVGGISSGILNPGLGSLEYNGGPTQTHLPNTFSPAFNKGDPSTQGGIDQIGRHRVSGGRADIGSVEMFSEPGGGDFNHDGQYSCSDIDALTNAVAFDGSLFIYDLNGDGELSLLDVDQWRAEAGEAVIGAGRAYQIGDANLDGVVDGTDFGRWNSSKFTQNTAWCSGNFNADTVIDGSDFGLWNSNKFLAADASRSNNDTLHSLNGIQSFGLDNKDVVRTASLKVLEPHMVFKNSHLSSRPTLMQWVYTGRGGRTRSPRQPVIDADFVPNTNPSIARLKNFRDSS